MTTDITQQLTSMGINLPEDKMAEFQAHFAETLEERVGLAIFDLLSDEEAEELLSLQDNEEASSEWITSHVPDYEEVVQDEFDILMGEIAQNPELITA